MSKTWKWILGVLAALVIVGVAVGAVILWRSHAPLTLARRVDRSWQYAQPAPRTPVAPDSPNFERRQGTPYGFGHGERNFYNGPTGRMPMLRGRGYHGGGGAGDHCLQYYP